MAIIGKNLGLTHGWVDGESGWGTSFNRDMAVLDVIAAGGVDGIVAAPAGSATDGTSYIVAAGTGAFAGKNGQIAVRYNNAWEFVTPIDGMLLSNKADSLVYWYASGAWTKLLAPATYSVPGQTMPDGKTTQADAGGVITVKDVAIGGDQSDLASARGQIGGSPAVSSPANLNDYTSQGNWFFFNAATVENFPINIGGWLSVYERSGYVYQFYRVINTDRSWMRRRAPAGAWSAWNIFLTTTQIGDGITVNNGVISVPEMQGATSAQAGVSGLVPPPLAADVGKVLGADGTWSFPKDIAIGGYITDLASARGQIGPARELGNNIDYNAVVQDGFYLVNASGSVNGPESGQAFFLHVFRSTNVSPINKNFIQIAYRYSSASNRIYIYVSL